MRIPDESLEDFTIDADKIITPEPPAAVSLQLSGKTRVVRPLARRESLAIRKPVRHRKPYTGAASGISWFHRSFATVGAVAVIAFFVATGIQLAIFGPPVEQVGTREVAIDTRPDDMAPGEAPSASDLLPEAETDSQPSFIEDNAPQPSAKRSFARTRTLRAAYRPRRISRRPHLVWSTFVPTTLIIYAVNGEIKYRIEPHFTDANRRS
jgi:hypothetical protein